SRPDFRPAAEMPVAMPAVPADVRAAAVTVHGETTFSVTMTTSIGGMVNVSAVDPVVTRARAADQSPPRLVQAGFRRTPSNAPAARPSALRTDGLSSAPAAANWSSSTRSRGR
ncbi:MAG TPA: hypothetical protein PKH97_15650, partial [Tetrasphaera sp.]|uniref:hypothetical protein n=1 Tax=Nostocoides sp. TaxID=1917966 RepID=UPI002CEF2FEB